MGGWTHWRLRDGSHRMMFRSPSGKEFCRSGYTWSDAQTLVRYLNGEVTS